MSDTPRTDAARDYTAPEKLDRLCQQLERECNAALLAAQNWEDTAAYHIRNEQFWFGLVTQIGELFGIEAKTADDGTVYDTVVALKVPELVERLRAERDRMKRELVEAGWTYTEGAERWKPPVNHKMGELWQRLFETESQRDALIETLEQVRTLSSKSYFTFPGYALAMKRIEEIVGDIEGQKNG